jgi:hypothetical protein
MVPLGSWSHHVYETNMPGLSLQQFGPGGGGALTVGLRNVPRPKWDLLLRASYGVLGTGAWERYAAAHGSNVSTSARLGNVGLLLTRDIDLAPSFRLAVGGGPGVAWGSGEESDPATTTYDYTMMKTAASLTIVVRGILALSSAFSLVGELAGVVGTSIVSYGPDDDRLLTALVGGVGVRGSPGGAPVGPRPRRIARWSWLWPCWRAPLRPWRPAAAAAATTTRPAPLERFATRRSCS